MEIVKELNLNGNPQVVPNGSLMYAKNIKLSDDGTYITNDDGFDTAFAEAEPSRDNLKVSSVVGTFCKSIKVTESGDGEHLVGYINCPNEIVLFVHKKYGYTDPDTQQEVNVEVSEIYRAIELKYDEEVEVEGEEELVTIHSDKLALYKVPTAWKYDNGKIIGTYTYNVYGHLIVAIAESDSYTIEIDSETGDEIHVPFDKQLMTIDLNDSSIEDPIDKYSCAPNIPICNLTLASKVKGNPMPHGLYYFFVRYEIVDKVYTNWFPIGAPQYALSLDFKTIIDHKYPVAATGTTTKRTQVSALVNTDKDSYYNFGFVIEFNDSYNYKGYQIGYILQTEDTAVGRLWKSFSFNDGISKSFTFNGGFDDEISLEDFSDNVLNVYNVKALANYNSKLYIGNFKETKYNIIDDEIRQCVNNIKAIQVKHIVDTNSEFESVGIIEWSYSIDNSEPVTIRVSKDKSSISFKDFPALVDLMANNMQDSAQGDNWRLASKNYNLVFREDGIYVTPEKEYGGQDYLGYNYYYYTGPRNRGFIWKYYKYNTNTGFGSDVVIGWSGRIDKTITISKKTETINHATYNTDKTIRTLMPQEVYAFYVHYVRPDGSFTNGYPLNNIIPNNPSLFLDDYYKTLEYLKENQPDILQAFHLNSIATINEMKDKYVYEIASWSYMNPDLTEYFFPYSCDDGRKLFKTGSGIITIDNVTKLLRIGVKFYNITYPKGYVGCFFSYEKVNSLSVYQAVVTEKFTGQNASIFCKSSDVEFYNTRYDGTVFIPHHKIDVNNGNAIVDVTGENEYSYINNAAPVLSNATISFLDDIIDRNGLHGGIAMNLSKDNETKEQPTEYVVGNILTFNRGLYSNDNKELIPFGPITTTDVYGETPDAYDAQTQKYIHDTTINYDMNYPSFIVQDNLFMYNARVYIDEKLAVHEIDSNGIIDPTSFYQNDHYAGIKPIWKFSNVNLLALSIKKEPENAAGVIDNNKNTINTIVKPVNASDLFKLESCYIPKVYKSYTNYNVKLVEANVFTNVIRATYPIRNESTVNSWRFLNPLSYYVIDNSNGEIVNMFGASSAFYIHTKNNLLVTTSNAKIEADNTEININNNNIFDVDPKEIFTSDLGYGGLKYQECHLFSQFGYIWYDTERYKLFRYDNGRLIDINSGIDELIKKYKFEKCYINIDNENNRILFAFDEGNGDSITLGYDTLGGKWLSLYDFTFNRAIHTANYAMFNIDFEVLLYKYSKSTTICDYKSLARYNSDLPFYGTLQIGGYPLIKYCCFDIIFNPNYTIPKVLNSISWIHEYITRNTLDNNHPAELKIINRTITNKINDLDGLIIDVYSDSVDSGLLEVTPPSGSKLNDVADPTNPNAYKYPYYNKGVWNYSYFRNNIVTPVTDVELAALAQAYGVDVNTLKNVYKITDKNGNQLYVDGNPAYAASDLRSLIYGKYIAVRFIFKNTNKLKFDNLVINVQKY